MGGWVGGRRTYLLVEEVEVILIEEIGEELAGEAVEVGLDGDVEAPIGGVGGWVGEYI